MQSVGPSETLNMGEISARLTKWLNESSGLRFKLANCGLAPPCGSSLNTEGTISGRAAGRTSGLLPGQ